MEENEYITRRGKKIKFVNIQGLLEAFYASHKEPEGPKYAVPKIGGGVEYHPLTEKTAETDEEKRALAAHQKVLAAHTEKVSQDFTNLILQRGIEFDIDDEAWITEQEQFGISVPTEPNARRKHYLQTEVLTGSKAEIQEDVSKIIAGVLNESGVDKEATAQLEAIFRGDVGVDTGNRDTGKKVVGRPSQGRLVLQSAVSTGRRGGGKNGQTHKLVRRPKRQ